MLNSATLCLCHVRHLKFGEIGEKQTKKLVSWRWYGSRLSASCQQKLFSSKHDTGGRYLSITLLGNRRKAIARIFLT